ncbi:MAG: porin family protein [Pseudomonadota bacterium]
MNHRRFAITICVLSALTFVSAYADEVRGFAISAGIGPSTIEDVDGDETFSGDGFGWSIDLEYRVSQYFALGLGVMSFGEADDFFEGADVSLEAGATNFFVRGVLPVTDSIELYGRLGSAIYSTDSRFFDLGEGPSYAVGIDIGRQEHWSFRIEGLRIDGEDREDGSLITAGVSYLF